MNGFKFICPTIDQHYAQEESWQTGVSAHFSVLADLEPCRVLSLRVLEDNYCKFVTY